MKKYNTAFLELVMLILPMTDSEQGDLLNQVKQIIDKRKKKRIPCLVPAYYRVRDLTYHSYILDLNDSGAFIETEQYFSVGQDINLRYFDPFSRMLSEIKGEIVWRDSDGIGVKFNSF